VQVYVDEIIFSATNEMLCEDFFKLMLKKIEMSMIGELEFLLEIRGAK